MSVACETQSRNSKDIGQRRVSTAAGSCGPSQTNDVETGQKQHCREAHLKQNQAGYIGYVPAIFVGGYPGGRASSRGEDVLDGFLRGPAIGARAGGGGVSFRVMLSRHHADRRRQIAAEWWDRVGGRKTARFGSELLPSEAEAGRERLLGRVAQCQWRHQGRHRAIRQCDGEYGQL